MGKFLNTTVCLLCISWFGLRIIHDVFPLLGNSNELTVIIIITIVIIVIMITFIIILL